MDNQLVNHEIENLMKRIAIIAVAILLVSLLVSVGVRQIQEKDPYIKNVLSLIGDPEKGHAIFQMNCAGCHDRDFNSQVGPNLHKVSQRKSDIDLIQQVIGGQTPPMPQFQPSPQEMADLLGYLEQL